MKCSRIREIISAFIDSEANPLEQLAMQEHVKDCSSCKKEVSDQYTLKNLVKAVGKTTPVVDFSPDIMKRINSHSYELAPQKPRSGIMVAAMAVVVLLVAVMGLRFEAGPGAPASSDFLAEHGVDSAVPEYAEYIYQHLSDDFAYAGHINYQR